MRAKDFVRWRARGGRRQVMVETQWHGRLLAALPDAITAAFLAWTWAAPMDAGRDAVLGGMALVGLEFPALLGLIGLFAAARSQSLLHKLRALVLTGFGLVAAVLVAWQLQRSATSPWVLFSFAWLLVGKWLVFATARRDGTWFADGLRLAVQFIALMLILSIAKDLPVPRWGFDEATIQQLTLPLKPDDPGGLRLAIGPWQLFAAGSLYFAFNAFVSGLLAVRRMAAVPT
jgi:hypothetical protein